MELKILIDGMSPGERKYRARIDMYEWVSDRFKDQFGKVRVSTYLKNTNTVHFLFQATGDEEFQKKVRSFWNRDSLKIDMDEAQGKDIVVYDETDAVPTKAYSNSFLTQAAKEKIKKKQSLFWKSKT